MVKRITDCLVKRFAPAAGMSRPRPVRPEPQYADLESDFLRLFETCRPYTMTSVERMYALHRAVQYVVNSNITGSVVECGVWKGGSSMIAAHTLRECGETARTIYLYDTFEGMVEPAERDVDYTQCAAAAEWQDSQRGGHNAWCYAPLKEVQANLYSTGYPRERIKFVEGKVEETIPAVGPEEIALLRLDTDWFESTYHELTHLFPRLVAGGVLIVDDYGHWQGCREAVDQYFAEQEISMLLSRVDYTGRVGIKLR